MSQTSMTLTPEIISSYIVEKCAALGIHDTSQMKLQKLVFFAWIWYGVLYKEKLFDEEPVAWEYGPFFQSLWKQTSIFGRNPITAEDLRYGSKDIKDKVLLEYLDNVIANYGKYSAYELKDKSHKEFWDKSHKTVDQVISWDDAVKYYKNNFIESVVLIEDKEAGVFTVMSHIIPGLVLEYSNYTKLLSEIQDIASNLIRENCKSSTD